ncbi:hypothetical protein R6Q59_031919 [Mikania micrantha]
MDRHIRISFPIPLVSLIIFFIDCILLTVPVIVSFIRHFLKHPQGLCPLQRIGVWLFLAALAIVAAEFTKINRLHMAWSYWEHRILSWKLRVCNLKTQDDDEEEEEIMDMQT